MYFKDLFNSYRLKSGYNTFSQFGLALAEEGFYYEDSIFSKWKNGERVPKDRKTVLAILKVFIKSGTHFNDESIHNFLFSVGQRDLDAFERKEILGLTTTKVKAYSEYIPPTEPSVSLYGISATLNNTRIIKLEDLSIQLQEFWQFQTHCAAAQYYAMASSGRVLADEIFKNISGGDFDSVESSYNYVAVTTDSLTGQEFLAATARYIYNTNDSNSIDLMRYIGLKGKWPHEKTRVPFPKVAEIDRLIVPNWSWSWRELIMKSILEDIFKLANTHHIEHLYSIMSEQMVELFKRLGFPMNYLPHSFPLGILPNAKILYPLAYYDIQEFGFYWKVHSKLYEFNIGDI